MGLLKKVKKFVKGGGIGDTIKGAVAIVQSPTAKLIDIFNGKDKGMPMPKFKSEKRAKTYGKIANVTGIAGVAIAAAGGAVAAAPLLGIGAGASGGGAALSTGGGLLSKIKGKEAVKPVKDIAIKPLVKHGLDLDAPMPKLVDVSQKIAVKAEKTNEKVSVFKKVGGLIDKITNKTKPISEKVEKASGVIGKLVDNIGDLKQNFVKDGKLNLKDKIDLPSLDVNAKADETNMAKAGMGLAALIALFFLMKRT